MIADPLLPTAAVRSHTVPSPPSINTRHDGSYGATSRVHAEYPGLSRSGAQSEGKGSRQARCMNFFFSSLFCVSLAMNADEPPVSYEVGSPPKMPSAVKFPSDRELRAGTPEAGFVCRQPWRGAGSSDENAVLSWLFRFSQ